MLKLCVCVCVRPERYMNVEAEEGEAQGEKVVKNIFKTLRQPEDQGDEVTHF